MNTNTIDSVARTVGDLIREESFYGHFLLGVPRRVTKDTQVKTAAVSLSERNLVQLTINDAFWNTLSKLHCYGLIKHEVLHLVLKHLFLQKNYSNKQLFNIAADLVVNQYIKPENLPTGGIKLEHFSYLKPLYGIELLPFKGTGYYYEQLSKILRKKPKMSLEEYAAKTGATIVNIDMGGGLGKEEKEKGGEELMDLNDLLTNSNEALDRHKFWEKFNQLSQGEQKIAEYQVNSMIKDTAERVKMKSKNYGNLPAGLVLLLEGILEELKPQFNWKRALRLFATTSNSSYLKNTIRRPSKRYGTTPGIKVKRKNRLLLAIDTSGSIQKDELVEFFSEIYFIWRQGAQIRIVECDTAIHSVYDYRGTVPETVSGRGGTSFDAPLEFGNTEYKPDGLIYFTDGYAAVPDIKPRYPVLWVISSNGLEDGEGVWKELPGRKLKISK